MPARRIDAVTYTNASVQTFKQPIPWIWDGVVAEDAVTLLSAPEKTGKTTLLSLARGCELGVFVRSGEGTRAEAFRYGLAQGQPAA